jgi:hypothetical protein
MSTNNGYETARFKARPHDEIFVRFCSMMFHDVSCCFTMFDDSSKKTLLKQRRTKISWKSHRCLMSGRASTWWDFHEIFVRRSFIMFHECSAFCCTHHLHETSSNKSHKCLTLFKTRPHDETFVRFWRCSQMFHVVSQMFDVKEVWLSRRSLVVWPRPTGCTENADQNPRRLLRGFCT